MVGSLFLLGTLAELVRGSLGFYQDFYSMPMEKYGVLTPLRWQDIVFLIGFYLVSAGLLYISYRLLKYSFGRKHSESVQ